MLDFLNSIMPNVMKKLPNLWESTIETLEMTLISWAFIFVLGLFFGVLLTVTKKGGLLQNAVVYQILDKVINLFRAVPFIILLICLIPLSRAIVGTSIGVAGAIVPLVFGTVPFFSRQVESALAEVNPGLIEAAEAMGCSRTGIIFRVYLKESIPALARGVTITLINLIGLTAMAGAVGSGGLGDFAIRYGHDRNMTDVTWVTVIVVFILVSIIQLVGNLVVKKNRH